jgi:hypothetical protein
MKKILSSKYIFLLFIIFQTNNIMAQDINYKLERHPLNYTGYYKYLKFSLNFKISDNDSNDIKIVFLKQINDTDSNSNSNNNIEIVSIFQFYDLDIGFYFFIWDISRELHDKYKGIYFYKLYKKDVLKDFKKFTIL